MISDLFEHCVCGIWMINGPGLHEMGAQRSRKRFMASEIWEMGGAKYHVHIVGREMMGY